MEDIHTATAFWSLVLKELEDVTPNGRRNTRLSTFSDLAGVSDFSLANNLGISWKLLRLQ